MRTKKKRRTPRVRAGAYRGMRKIPLTTRPVVEGSPFPGTVIDAAVIKTVITTPDPQRGMDLEDMRQGMKVLDALERVNGTNTLILENAQWETLCARVRTFKWGIADRRFLDLADAILSAEEFTPPPPTPAEAQP